MRKALFGLIVWSACLWLGCSFAAEEGSERTRIEQVQFVTSQFSLNVGEQKTIGLTITPASVSNRSKVADKALDPEVARGLPVV